METKSSVSARSKWSKAMDQWTQVGCHRTIRRQFVQHIGLHFHELHNGIAAKPAPIQDKCGIMRGRCVHRHRHLIPVRDGPDPSAAIPSACSCAPRSHTWPPTTAVPVEPRVVIERGLGEIPAHTVVNLPRDELRMLPQRLRHVFYDTLGIIPKIHRCSGRRRAGCLRASRDPVRRAEEFPDASW